MLCQLTHEQVAEAAARGAVALERLVLGQRGRERDAELDVATVAGSRICLARLGLRGCGFSSRHGVVVSWEQGKIVGGVGCCDVYAMWLSHLLEQTCLLPW